jgi:hypothetical protein
MEIILNNKAFFIKKNSSVFGLPLISYLELPDMILLCPA